METSEGSFGSSTHTSESHHERLHLEPVYEAFCCPLTKEVMQEPVSLENGQTYERAAIEKWFKECKDNGRKPICPLTSVELNTTNLNPSRALQKAIEEWRQRNDAALLSMSCDLLSSDSSEADILKALNLVQEICQKSRAHKHILHNTNIIPMITGMLKNIHREVRCKALETLRMVSEDDDDNKEAVAVGDTVRTIVKFLYNDLPRERGGAVALLYELSKSESICQKIGGIPGSILILLGMSSSSSEDILTVQKAEQTLENLETCEMNVLQMAENGRLQPLLKLLLEGLPETQLTMATHLGNLVVSNDLQVLVAQTAGRSLVSIMKTGNLEAREASLKALSRISSNESSARLLLEQDILRPLIKDLFSVGINQLPMRLKEISATILANIVACGANFETISVGQKNQTLVSEDIICNLLHLISNTGPAIESKLLQVLVGLTSSSASVQNIVSSIKSSGAIISLIQFIEAPQIDLRLASVKLLQNISPHMAPELADAFRKTAGHLGSLMKLISHGISEEQVAAVGILAELPERDLALTRCLLKEGAFDVVFQKLQSVRQGEGRVGRYFNCLTEGLACVLARITYHMDEESALLFSRENNLTTFFTDLLQANNGLDMVQIKSALALQNLSQKSKVLTRVPENPKPGFCCVIFPCCTKEPDIVGLCKVHHGFCSAKETFCLVDAKAVDKLVACLDHTNENIVEVSLAAICTLLGNDVDSQEGVLVLRKVEGIYPIVKVLIENRTKVLQQLSVYAIEKILRSEEISYQLSENASIAAALVDAFKHGDNKTKQIAESALKLINRLPNFSGIFSKMG